jgi:hypothetical protein
MAEPGWIDNVRIAMKACKMRKQVVITFVIRRFIQTLFVLPIVTRCGDLEDEPVRLSTVKGYFRDNLNSECYSQ